MGRPQKKDDFPIRYSLLPAQRREIAAKLVGHTDIKERQLVALCREYYVAKKVLVELMEQLGIDILLAPRSHRDKAKDLADKVFKPKVVEQSAPTPLPEAASIVDTNVELDEAMQLVADMESELNAREDKMLGDLADMEAELL